MSDHSTHKPTITVKDPKRFWLQQEKERLSEQWTRARLIDEIYLRLMSLRHRDEQGTVCRKYEDGVRYEMGWMPIPPHSSRITVSLKDLDAKIREELFSYDSESREAILNEAVGMICERIDSRTYLLSAKQYLKVELVE